MVAYFADLDEGAKPLLIALGQVVLAVATLEGNLRLELARLLLSDRAGREAAVGETLAEQVAELESLTAGQLLHRLREQGLPGSLERRIAAVVSRRNRLVHRPFEDPQLVGAVAGGEAAVEAIAHLEQLALECAALAVELQTFALPKIEALMGAPKEQLLELALSIDPTQIQPGLDREKVEAIQALGAAADRAGHSKPASQLLDRSWGPGSHHRLTVDWQGEQVETLADLLRPGLRAVCIGINPSPASVAAGHYYQGRIGRRFWHRLQQVGVIEPAERGREDDAAFLNGIGFTDIVKRPTPRAAAISTAEFEHGRELLVEKLCRYRPPILIFTFKKTATVLFGRFKGHGHRPEREFAGAQVFVMPGPYERADRVAAALEQLRGLFAD